MKDDHDHPKNVAPAGEQQPDKTAGHDHDDDPFWQEPPADKSWGIHFWCSLENTSSLTPVINPQTGKPMKIDEWDFE